MFLTWRRSPFVVQMPLYNTPDDLGGGGGDLAGADEGAHPEYDVDLGEGGDDDPALDPSTQGAQPGTPVRQPAQGGTPGGGQDPRTQQPQITAEQYTTLATSYRTLESNLSQVLAQNQLLQRQVAALTGVQPPQQQPQTQLSEADQKAVEAVYRLFPQLKPLLEKAQDLLSLPETVNGFKSEAERRWIDVGTRMWDAFDRSVGEAFGGQNLHPFAKQSLDSAFITWLETDKNAQARYRMGDTTLAAEFVKMYRNGVIAPAQRAGSPQPRGARPGQPGQQQPPRVPRGGPGQPAVGQRPAQPNVKKPDEVHDAAADAYFASRS